jgi:hypothetical protein
MCSHAYFICYSTKIGHYSYDLDYNLWWLTTFYFLIYLLGLSPEIECLHKYTMEPHKILFLLEGLLLVGNCSPLEKNRQPEVPNFENRILTATRGTWRRESDPDSNQR